MFPPPAGGGGTGSGTVTQVVASPPLSGGTITANGSVGCPTATSLVAGCLAAADWSSFNAKGAGTLTQLVFSSPLTGGTVTSTGSIGCQTATAIVAGCLSAADWATFNGKGSGTLTQVVATAPLTGGTITGSGSVGCQTASGSQAGCLAAADWTTFNGKGAGTVSILSAVSAACLTTFVSTGVQIQCPNGSATLDASGNLVTPGNGNFGVASGVVGAVVLNDGSGNPYVLSAAAGASGGIALDLPQALGTGTASLAGILTVGSGFVYSATYTSGVTWATAPATCTWTVTSPNGGTNAVLTMIYSVTPTAGTPFSVTTAGTGFNLPVTTAAYTSGAGCSGTATIAAVVGAQVSISPQVPADTTAGQLEVTGASAPSTIFTCGVDNVPFYAAATNVLSCSHTIQLGQASTSNGLLSLASAGAAGIGSIQYRGASTYSFSLPDGAGTTGAAQTLGTNACAGSLTNSSSFGSVLTSAGGSPNPNIWAAPYAAGLYTSATTGTCAFTITFPAGLTAAHGWACHAEDTGTSIGAITQTGGSASTATFSGVTTTGDPVRYLCAPY